MCSGLASNTRACCAACARTGNSSCIHTGSRAGVRTARAYSLPSCPRDRLSERRLPNPAGLLRLPDSASLLRLAGVLPVLRPGSLRLPPNLPRPPRRRTLRRPPHLPTLRLTAVRLSSLRLANLRLPALRLPALRLADRRLLLSGMAWLALPSWWRTSS
jgi:hypothetical protein